MEISSSSSSKRTRLIDQCVSMVKKIVLKPQKRSPLKYLIVRYSSCLVPRSIVNESENVISQFNKVVPKLFKHQKLNNMELNYNLKNLLPIMFHDMPITITVLMYPCNAG